METKQSIKARTVAQNSVDLLNDVYNKTNDGQWSNLENLGTFGYREYFEKMLPESGKLVATPNVAVFNKYRITTYTRGEKSSNPGTVGKMVHAVYDILNAKGQPVINKDGNPLQVLTGEAASSNLDKLSKEELKEALESDSVKLMILKDL